MRLLQWNVWYKESLANIESLLRKYNPDVACLQELRFKSPWTGDPKAPDTLSERLGYHLHFSEAHRFQDGAIQGNAIYSRDPLVHLPGRVLQASVGDGTDATREGRSLAMVMVKHPSRDITVATTHLSYSPGLELTGLRRLELARLMPHLQAQGNFIFTGDLNLPSNSPVIPLLEQRLHHAGPDYRLPTWTTKPFEANGFSETELKWRLDYVFHTPDITVRKAEIIKTEYSDHLPILIDFEL